MGVVLLKNLFAYGQPTGAGITTTSSEAHLAHKTRSGEKAIDGSCVTPTSLSSGDIESQGPTGRRTPIEPDIPCNSRSWIRGAWTALTGFRPTPRMISDAIIGLADGMTVPFALTAGLSSLGSTRIVQLGGVAELIAGMISMGVGGALGAKAESDGFKAKMADTLKLVLGSSADAVDLVHETLNPYGFDLGQRNVISDQLRQSSEKMVDFLIRFHYQEKEPESSRPWSCGLTIGLGYGVGGLIPLIPYFCVGVHEVFLALYISIGVMAVTLFLFGYFKTVLLAEQDCEKSTWKAFKGGLWMMGLGGGSAAVAVGAVHGIQMASPAMEH
ncbi:MAG: hypothetical protein L6R38_005637 [Xanthoria sp. 2 TBL-2021]|nr:MAG: hypothetical protein L6R38_005637 [Xanthoria sp. 2 TBL-2021]